MNTSVPFDFPASLKLLAQCEAELILKEVEGVQAVVIATIDGFDVASAIQTALDAPRLAALASSIAAIGDVVSKEARLGDTKSVTVDTTAGVAMIFTVRRVDVSLVVNVIADSRALFGQIAYRTAAAARLLADMTVN